MTVLTFYVQRSLAKMRAFQYLSISAESWTMMGHEAEVAGQVSGESAVGHRSQVMSPSLGADDGASTRAQEPATAAAAEAAEGRKGKQKALVGGTGAKGRPDAAGREASLRAAHSASQEAC